VLEVVRLAQAGYPSRCVLEQFASRYAVPDLAGYEGRQADESARQACHRLLARYGIEPSCYVFGTTKVFFRCVRGGRPGRAAVRWRCGRVWGLAGGAASRRVRSWPPGCHRCRHKQAALGWHAPLTPCFSAAGPACWGASRTCAPPSSAWCGGRRPDHLPPAPPLPLRPAAPGQSPAAAAALLLLPLLPLLPTTPPLPAACPGAGRRGPHVRHLLALAHLARQAAACGAGHAAHVAVGAGQAQAAGVLRGCLRTVGPLSS
jgi:hypothetical protein